MVVFRGGGTSHQQPRLNGAAPHRRQPFSPGMPGIQAAGGAERQTGQPIRRCSDIRRQRVGVFTPPGDPEVIGAQVGQLAFEAFDVEPERPALVEQ